jgi:hypothetical protein
MKNRLSNVPLALSTLCVVGNLVHAMERDPQEEYCPFTPISALDVEAELREHGFPLTEKAKEKFSICTDHLKISPEKTAGEYFDFRDSPKRVRGLRLLEEDVLEDWPTDRSWGCIEWKLTYVTPMTREEIADRKITEAKLKKIRLGAHVQACEFKIVFDNPLLGTVIMSFETKFEIKSETLTNLMRRYDRAQKKPKAKRTTCL